VANIIFLEGLNTLENERDAIKICKKLFRIAHTIAPITSKDGGLFISVQSTGGDFGLTGVEPPYVFLGGLPGIVKTAFLEWPKASVKSIDINKNDKSKEEIAELLFKELIEGGAEIEVGIIDKDKRVTLKNEEAKEGIRKNFIDENSVIIVSGGARGVTAVSTIELARRHKPKIVLFGRTALIEEPSFLKGVVGDAAIKKALLENAKQKGEVILPAKLGEETSKILAQREIKDTLDKIKKAGSQVKYFSVDITDYEKVNQCLDEVRQEWGEITGFVHGAGVIADKLIIDKTQEQFDMVFKTKVEGLRTLLKATEKDNLKVICLFSSVAGRFGNMGQCDYAMANEILNKVANYEAKKRGENCIVKAINWGPWEGGMVTPFLKKHMQQMGIPLIPLDEGARAFCDELTYLNNGCAEVIIGPDLPKEGFTIMKEKEKTFHILISEKRLPYISSHKINGAIVLPAVTVIDFTMRAVLGYRPFLKIKKLESFTLRKGIQINDNESQLLKIKCMENEEFVDTLLLDQNDVLRYTVKIYTGLESNKPRLISKDLTNRELLEWPYNVDEAYNKYLFHGRDFRVIKELKGVSKEGASAVLLGSIDLRWPYENFIVDQAVLDGGGQLQILWGQFIDGTLSLPVSIESFIPYVFGPMRGPINVELESVSANEMKKVANLYYFNANGELLYEFRGLTMYTLFSKTFK
jgi:NAD(P)-dependent dehydrogenase (short-subunit alcohol dehydrogenase family)